MIIERHPEGQPS